MQLQKRIQAGLCNRLPGSAEKAAWISWDRPAAYWDVVGAHLLPALVTGIPLLLSFLAPLRLLPLLPCTFLQRTGYPCPFCGFTRSFWAMSSGDWAYAMQNYPLVGPLYLVVVAVFTWNIAGLIGGVRLARGTRLALRRKNPQLLIILSAAMFLLNWFYRLRLGFE